MLTPTYGDRAAGFQLRRQTTDLKTQMTKLNTEVTTGRTADLQSFLGGDYTALTGLDRSLRLREAYGAGNKQAAQFAEVQQLALEDMQGLAAETAPAFLSTAATGSDQNVSAAFARAASDFDTLVARLNSSTGTRSVFAGAATGGGSVADGATLLAGLGSAVAGQVTVSGIMAAADAWFDTPGGGYETTGYLGSQTALAPMTVGEGTQVTLDVTARDPALRETLKAFALSALVDQGLLAGNPGGQKQLLKDLGERLVTSNDGLIGLQAGIGYAQEKTEAAATRTTSEVTSLNLAMDALIGVDEYDAATQLKDVQTKLESVYSLTARLSELSLTKVLG